MGVSERNSIDLNTRFHLDERRESDVRLTIDRLLDEIQRKEQSYRCDLCQREFRSLFQLDQHRHSSIHHEQQFRCEFENCTKMFRYARNLRQHVKNHHENSSRFACPISPCSKSYAFQSSLTRHLNQNHTPKDIIHQIEKKNKRLTNIQGRLSGFNSRKLNDESNLGQQMKYLLKMLLNDENFVDFSEDSMEIESSCDREINSTLLEGYRDLGLVEL